MICGININKGKKDERNIKKAIAMSTIFVLLLAQMSGTKYAKAVEINTAELSNWYVYDHYDTAVYADETAWFNSGKYKKAVRPYYTYTEEKVKEGNTASWIKDITEEKWGYAFALGEHVSSSVDTNGANNMLFYGYCAPYFNGYTDFAYYPAASDTTKSVNFKVNATNVKTHSLIHAGYLFNCGISGSDLDTQTLSGYAMVFQYTGGTDRAESADGLASASLLKLDKVSVKDLHNSGSKGLLEGLNVERISGVSTLDTTDLSSYTFSDGYNVSDIAMKITDTGFKATMTAVGTGASNADTVVLFNKTNLENTNMGGFGPVVGYANHACDYTSSYEFSDLKMSMTMNATLNGQLSAEGQDVDNLSVTENTMGENKVQEGAAYATKIVADAGYQLPKTIIVKCGGTALRSGTDYTYDNTTGDIVIWKDAINASIEIIADTYNISSDLSGGLTCEGEISGSSYMDSVVTLLGDEYPDVVRVRVGEQLYTVAKDTPITIGTDGQIIYDGTTHSITIEKGTVEGDVTIYASNEKYNVTNTLSHITSKNGNGTTIVEKNYTDVLIPESGYELPRTIEVTVSGRTLVVGTDYTYDIKTGQVNINADKVTGDIEIKAVGTQIVYDVELSGNNISATEGTIGTGKAMKEKQYETVLTPNVGYLLPDAIVVEVSGKVLTSGTDYTYDNQTGRVVIYNKAVTGNVKIVVGMLVEASVTAPDSSLIKTKNPAYLDSYDGEISGVTPAMEYSSDNGDIWNRCVSTKMTGLSVGTYLIRYAATPSQVASSSITVKLVCKSGELNIPTIKMSKILGIKKKFRIKLINTKGAVVTCKSSNTKIAVVNKRGLVKSKTKTGKAKIVIGITKGRHKVQYIMNVTVRKGVKKNYSLVRFNTKSKNPSIVLYKLLEKGASWKIRLAHTNKTTKLNFKSSDKKIAEINKKGKITSKSLGKAIITARVKQNGVTNIYYVVVRVTDGNRKSDTSYLKVIK